MVAEPPDQLAQVEPLRMPTTRASAAKTMWFNKASFIASEVDGEIFGNCYAIQ